MSPKRLVLLALALVPAIAIACTGTDPIGTLDRSGTDGSAGSESGGPAGDAGEPGTAPSDGGAVDGTTYRNPLISEQRILNSDFESAGTQCDHWSGGGGATLTTYTKDSHSGAQSCLVCMTADAGTGYGIAQYRDTGGPPAFLDGGTYLGEIWVKRAPADAGRPPSDKLTLSINLGDDCGCGEVVTTPDPFDAPVDWARVASTYTFVPKGNAHYIEFQVFDDHAFSGCFLIDDASFGLLSKQPTTH